MYYFVIRMLLRNTEKSRGWTFIKRLFIGDIYMTASYMTGHHCNEQT